MSDKYFYNKFMGALLDIIELVQLEQYPGEVNNGTAQISDAWMPHDWLNFQVNLYVKYIDILKSVDDSYDQIIHPQMRKTIKRFLENLLCRVNQIKAEVIYYHYPLGGTNIKPCNYTFLDDYLIEMKLEPEAINLPIPNFFRENSSEEVQMRRILLDEKLKEKYGSALPEKDVTNFFFKFDLNFEEAIKILQNFEVGRQNMKRITKSLRLAQKKTDDNPSDKKVLLEEDRKKVEIDRLIAVQKLKRAREEELKFLKMVPEDKEENIYLQFAEHNRKARKEKQKQREEQYESYKEELEEKIKIIEGYDIKEALKNQRRDWINKERAENKGEPPVSIDLFYKRFEVEKKVELNDQQKKLQEDQAKEKLKKEQDKKKGEEKGNVIQTKLFSGPTDQVKNLTDLVEDFKMTFETSSDYISQKETFLSNIARDEIIGDVQQVIKEEVDALINMEIKNLRMLKGKKEPKASKKKPKVKPEKLGPGEKPLAKIDNKELFADAVHMGILRKMVPKYLDDLICDFNYVAKAMLTVEEKCPEIPLFYTKQLVKELCIYPLGCQMVRSQAKFVSNSILFHGPPGTGKTHAAMAVAYHTDALFFDLSPKNLEKFQTKEEVTKAVATAFRVARFFQPAILYFDCAEQVFPMAKPKKSIKNPNASRLKKLFITYVKLIKPDDRILFIGNTNKGFDMNPKEFKQMFDKTLNFGNPSYADRYLIWKSYITKKIGREYDLEYNILAQMSNSFPGEAILATIDYVLSKHRLERLKFNSLTVQEFISTLSKSGYLFEDEFTLNRDFLYKASGLAEIHNYFKELRDDQEKGKKGK